MLRPSLPASLYPSYASLYGLQGLPQGLPQGLQGLRYPPGMASGLPEVLPAHLSMLAAERLKLEEEHRLQRLREEEKERERERDRDQREQRERDRERKQEEDRERDRERRDKAPAAKRGGSPPHHDSTGESVSRPPAGHLTQ